MLKIWSMKKQQQEQQLADTAAGKKKVTAAEIRIQTEYSKQKELEKALGPTMKLNPKSADDLLNNVLVITPDEGPYQGGKFTFSISIPSEYPIKPPDVLCEQKIYHPNIEPSGKICLNILRGGWMPMFELKTIAIGLQFLFLEPNASDPLNHEVADEMKASRDTFRRNLKVAMAGGKVRGVAYDNVLIAKR